jgi:hypothetical protein
MRTPEQNAPFRTRPEHVGVQWYGWTRLPSGVWLTVFPLVDTSTPEPLFARCTYADAKAACANQGGRLPTRAETLEALEIAKNAGIVLRPVTLSFGPEMVSRGHAEEHDAAVCKQLDAWTPGQPVWGIGKHWIDGATGENVRICGWWNGSKLIQSGIALNNPHHRGGARSHTDYGTLFHAARDEAPV